MEVGAVAQAAMRLGKPWAAAGAVTDDANGDSARLPRPPVRAARIAGAAIERLVARVSG